MFEKMPTELIYKVLAITAIIVIIFIFLINIDILGPKGYRYSMFDRYYPETRSKLWEPDTDILRENLFLADDILKKHSIDFNLSEGTALGSIREHDIIKGDTDVDIEMDISELEKFKKAIPDFRRKGFKIMRYWVDTNLNGKVINFISLSRNSHYIDFQFSGKGLNCVSMEDNPPGPCDQFLSTKEPYQEGKIGNRKFKTPSMEYIELLYGPTWNTPRKGFKANTLKRVDGKLV